MDKKGILMAIGLGLLSVYWVVYLMPMMAPEPQVIDQQGEHQSLDEPENNSTRQNQETATSPNPENTDPKDVVLKKIDPEDAVSKKVVAAFTPLAPVVIDFEDTYSFTVDPQRGVTQIELKEYKHEVSNPDIKVKIGSNQYPSLFLTGIADKWTYSKPEVTKKENQLIIKKSVIGLNLDIIQTITLGKDYQFQTSFKLINTGTKAIDLNSLGINCGNIGPLSGSVGMMAGMDQTVDTYDIEDESVSTHTLADIIKETAETEQEKNLKAGEATYFLERPEKGFQWISVKNRYFAWIVDFEEGFKDCEVGYNILEEKTGAEVKEEDKVNLVTATGYLKAFTIPAGSSKEITFECYGGAQKLGILRELDHHKKGVMQLNLFMWFKVGWIGVVSELMLNGLLWLYSFIGSYGLSIIMLTIIVKALFWRLTNKSTESMKKMSALSPKMKEINAKYKDNPQVKQQEIMKLYRENGVNPIAGCLPLFLQMPVFIALFNALRGAIELRHSEFLWIADLSRPDTIFTISAIGLDIRPLAIAWAISMVIQQKVVPSTADPAQKKIMMFMPVFMLFVCYGMPSGLTLYWTFSTMMSILQYYLNNKKSAGKEKELPVKTTATG
jgi:YidC/Oxa1 family membrane protein insertase